MYEDRIMGYINKLWDNDSVSVYNMKLKQVIVLAGDGIIEHKDTYEELRLFFTKIDTTMIFKFIKECLSEEKEDKFDGRGFILQDLINEIGRRFGYKVIHGLYKGKKGANGFDGLWYNPNGSSIIIESKTSDAYTLNIDSIIGYRKKLLANHQIVRNECSILIVLGREDKNTFLNIVKGSNETQNIRIISVAALSKLLEIYENSGQNKTIQNKIMNLLVPHDFVQLDNLVDLVFLKDFGIDKPLNKSEAYICIPELPDKKLPIGKFVYEALRNLSKSGYVFSNKQLECFITKEWSHKVLKLNYPFFKYYNPSDPKGHYIGKAQRFYAKTFLFGDAIVYVTKELFEKNREPFIEWYNTLKNII